MVDIERAGHDLERIMFELSASITRWTEDMIEGRIVYFGLRAIELALARSIEEHFGPAELASIQSAAFEQSSHVHTQPWKPR